MATPLGLGLSIGAMYGLQWFLNVLMDGASTLSIVEIDCGVLAVSTLLMIVTVYASSFLPAYYVGKLSPLAAINSQTILRKEKITHRKSKILPKILNLILCSFNNTEISLIISLTCESLSAFLC